MNRSIAEEQAPTDFSDAIHRGLMALSLPLSENQQLMLVNYLLLMHKWNRIYNLTAIRDYDQMIVQHLLDSLAVVPHLGLEDGAANLLDVGSGAGLPGVPIAIARPDTRVTVLDSNQKKAAFMRHAATELQLPNVDVVNARVETWQGAPFRIIVSRAYAELSQFIGQTVHLLAENGLFAAMKGRYPGEEIERLPGGFAVRDCLPLQVPGLDAERHLVLVGRA